MEYLLLFIEYHIVRKGRVIKNIAIPVIIWLLVYFHSSHTYQDVNTYCSNATNILGILIGFSISVFAILLSLENDNIREAKNKTIKAKLYSKPVSLYEALLVDFAYIIFVQGLLLITNIFLPLFIDASRTFFAIDTAAIVYVVVLILQCVLDMYLILTKKHK